MKHTLFFIFLTLSAFTAFAQETPTTSSVLPKSSVGIHAGISWVGVFTRLANHYNTVERITASAPPALELSYERKLTPTISIGGNISRQAFSLRYQNYEYTDANGQQRTDNFRTGLSRLNIGFRGLLHYFRTANKEMYSGIRLGISSWSFHTNAKDPKYTVAKYVNQALGTHPSAQLILLGYTGYFTPHLGGNAELAVGAPHFFSFGVVYRW